MFFHATASSSDGSRRRARAWLAMNDALALVIVDANPNATTALTLALRSLVPDWSLSVARSAPVAQGLLHVQRVDVVVSDGDLPVAQSADLGREILLSFPGIVHIRCESDPRKLHPTYSSRWSERRLAKPCPVELLVHEIRTARIRAQSDLAPRAQTSAARGGASILVLDESDEDCAVLHNAFARVHPACTLHRVASNAKAFQFLSQLGECAGQPTPDLILCDLGMYERSDFTMLSRSSALALIPLVVLGNRAQDPALGHALRHGASAYIRKPTTWDRWLDLSHNLGRCAHLSADSHTAPL